MSAGLSSLPAQPLVSVFSFLVQPHDTCGPVLCCLSTTLQSISKFLPISIPSLGHCALFSLFFKLSILEFSFLFRAIAFLPFLSVFLSVCLSVPVSLFLSTSLPLSPSLSLSLCLCLLSFLLLSLSLCFHVEVKGQPWLCSL